jgi:hypothetical protein
MNQLLENVQSNETKIRHNALETILSRLNNDNSKKLFGIDNDVNIRLYSSIISLIKDANPKIVILSLDITQVFFFIVVKCSHSLSSLMLSSLLSLL